MSEFDYLAIKMARESNAWKLLRADYAPLVLSFLDREFISQNRRRIPKHELEEKLEIYLGSLRAHEDENTLFGKDKDKLPEDYRDHLRYLVKNGWLRDIVENNLYDIDYSADKAIECAKILCRITDTKTIVGTESVFANAIQTLDNLIKGSETDMEALLKQCDEQKKFWDHEKQKILKGQYVPKDSTSKREHAFQFMESIDRLKSNLYYSAEQFKTLKREKKKEMIENAGANNQGSIIRSILDEAKAIRNTDQGKCLTGLIKMLNDKDIMDNMSSNLEKFVEMPEVKELGYGYEVVNIPYDLHKVLEEVLEVMRKQDDEINKFLKRGIVSEHENITKAVQEIEKLSLGITETCIPDFKIEVIVPGIDSSCPASRTLYEHLYKPTLDSTNVVEAEEPDVKITAVDRAIDITVLKQNIRTAMKDRSIITLKEVINEFPVCMGIKEIGAYLSIIYNSPLAGYIDDNTIDTIVWTGINGKKHISNMPRVIYFRAV